MSGCLDDILRVGLDSLPAVSPSTQSGYRCGHSVPVNGLFDVEPTLQGSKDGFGMMGKLPGLGVVGSPTMAKASLGRPSLVSSFDTASLTLDIIPPLRLR